MFEEWADIDESIKNKIRTVDLNNIKNELHNISKIQLRQEDFCLSSKELKNKYNSSKSSDLKRYYNLMNLYSEVDDESLRLKVRLIIGMITNDRRQLSCNIRVN